MDFMGEVADYNHLPIREVLRWSWREILVQRQHIIRSYRRQLAAMRDRGDLAEAWARLRAGAE